MTLMSLGLSTIFHFGFLTNASTLSNGLVQRLTFKASWIGVEIMWYQ